MGNKFSAHGDVFYSLKVMVNEETQSHWYSGVPMSHEGAFTACKDYRAIKKCGSHKCGKGCKCFVGRALTNFNNFSNPVFWETDFCYKDLAGCLR